ncbi:MAG: fibronectin type III domain-containing protein, partial [Reichenbachiella sp.]|uniref:fibronectin type III domain-containing protein n=1 Tax=Reichenbachiella sp. TaxID=2184521 RepID=UPI00326652EB
MKYMIKSLAFVAFFVSISIQVLASCPGLGAFSINSISASNITESTIYLTWTSSANADNYKVFYRIGTGDWVQSPGTIVAGSTREHTISGLFGGVTYGIIVTAFDFCEDGDGGGGGGGGGEIPFAPLSLIRDRSTSVRTVLTEPVKPSTRSADDQAVSSFLARWHSTNTATSYRLDVSTSSSFSSFVSGYNNKNVGSVTEASVTGLQSATKYYYRIRAVNGSGTSVSSNGRNAYTIPNTPSLNNASNQEQNSFEASWGAVTRADSYRLDVSTSSSFSSYVSGYNNRSVLGTSQTVTGLNPGTTYYFRVRAYDTSGTTTSSSSASKSTITIPDEPNTSAPSHLNQTSFRANWVAETGASSYRLDVSEVSDFSSVVDGYDNKFSSGTSETVIGLDGGKTYYYRVQAVNSSGFSDPSPVHGTVLLKPANPSAESASNPEPHQFTANWQDNTISPDSYLVEIADNDDFINPLAGYDDPITGTSIDIIGLDGGTTYYYRLKAINNSGESNYSNVIEIITVPGQPQTTTPSDFSETSFSANWEAEGGSSAYYLDVSESDDFSSFLPGYNNLFVNGTTQEISDLARGSSYYYRVKAANSSGISISSTGEPALTISQAPTPQSATDYTQAEFVTHWEAVSGADSYLLDVSESDNFSSFVSGYQNLAV